jgi:hypothetical protein
MGGSSSKPPSQISSSLDLSNASLSVSDAQRQLEYNAKVAAQELANAAESASAYTWSVIKILSGSFFFILIIAAIGLAIYYSYNITPNLKNVLIIDSAKLKDPMYGPNGGDITSSIQAMVKGDSLYKPSGIIDISVSDLKCLGSTGNDIKNCSEVKGELEIRYHYEGPNIDNGIRTTPANHSVTDAIDISPANTYDINLMNAISAQNKYAEQKKIPPGKESFTPGPTTVGKVTNILNFSGSSPNLLPYTKDAQTIATIQSGSAPLSAGTQGAYGMQFWMYIKDWNYNFGKDKNVIVRSDPTNNGIMNPKISLHPTDNSLKVSVSVFPDSTGTSSKTEPAPYGHSGSTDDVFICEVPDIPLQTWVAVSVTVFSRNLDVYLNGKLVKSCVLSGVPKPVSGDITLNGDGGFSGHLCNFYHYPRMLEPGDAQSFFSQGHSCSADTDSKVAKATGYGFKFGIYDVQGKQLSQYVL